MYTKMLNSLLTKWINEDLIRDLEKAVTRIPKDLKTWKKLVGKLKYARTPKKKKQCREYSHLYSYYLGKMIAYIYVLEKLGDSKFVSQWEKKFKVKYLKMDKRPDGNTAVSGKW